MPQMDATGVDDKEGCDAYVVLRFDGEERFRSPTVEESYTPTWGCSHVLPIPRLSQSLPLIVQVWDEDEVHDELIGQTSVNFIGLTRGQREERWHTITAEGYKAFTAVQAKTDTTHAGRVLMAITLDFAHAFAAEEQAQGETAEEETQIFYKWGQASTSVHEDYDIGRLNLSTGTVRELLAKCLSLVRDGINVAVKKNLHGAVNSLIKACDYQNAGKLYDARLLVEEASRFADKELAMLHNDSEDRILAAKVAMVCIALKHSNNLQKTSEECKWHLMHVMAIPEIVSALDDELTGSDPDHKYLRSSNAPRCCCTENQPGARIFRHRLLNDLRNLTLTSKEELKIAGVRGDAPNIFRSGREGTRYPGPYGRDVDNCLELISCADAITLKGHLQAVTAICVYDDWLFSAASDKTIRVWSLTSCQCIRVLDLHHTDTINCIAVCPGRFDMQLYSGAENIKSFDVTQKVLASDKRARCCHTLEHHRGAIICMVTDMYMPKDEQDIHPKGWRLYTGSVDRSINVYETAFIGTVGINTDDPRPIAVLKGHKSTITTLAVARRLIFSGSLDTTIMVWCCSKFNCLRSVSTRGDIINCFSVVAARLYVATSDRAIFVYDIENLKQVCRLEGHGAYVYALTAKASPLTKDISTLIQDENPMFMMQQRIAQQLTYSSYKNGEDCKRFSVVTIGIRRAKNLEAQDHRPGQEGLSDPFVQLSIGGDVRISGRINTVKQVSTRTAVLKETLNPRWNETFTFILPELLDYKVSAGSSVRAIPIRFEVWDWNLTSNDFMGSWKGVVGDLLPDVITKKSRVYGADGTAPPDDGDVGGWVYLEPEECIVGKDVPVKLGLKVGITEEGYKWMEKKMIADESKGQAGYICKIAAGTELCLPVCQPARPPASLSSSPCSPAGCFARILRPIIWPAVPGSGLTHLHRWYFRRTSSARCVAAYHWGGEGGCLPSGWLGERSYIRSRASRLLLFADLGREAKTARRAHDILQRICPHQRRRLPDGAPTHFPIFRL